MATTTLLPRHAGEGETIAAAIRDCLDYGKNPEKTEGKYISAYECDPATVAEEFLLAKASYKAATGGSRKRKRTYSVTRYAWPSIPARSHRKRQTVSAMNWLCAGRRAATPSL